MKTRKSDFGERIVQLEVATGSQKALAKSLGVSTRTIRRWKHRRDVEIPSRVKLTEKKLRSRERYRYYRKTRHIAIPRKLTEIVLNDFAGSEALSDLAAEMNRRYPELTKTILADRPDIAITILKITFGDGSSDISVPLTGSDQFDRLLAEGYKASTHYISGKDYHDWPSLSALLWLRFREVYPGKDV